MTMQFTARKTQQGAVYVEASPGSDDEIHAMDYYDGQGGVLSLIPDFCRHRSLHIALKHTDFTDEFQTQVSDPKVSYSNRIILVVASGASCSSIYTAMYIVEKLCEFDFGALLKLADPDRYVQQEF